jgi:hypothetical protein
MFGMLCQLLSSMVGFDMSRIKTTILLCVHRSITIHKSHAIDVSLVHMLLTFHVTILSSILRLTAILYVLLIKFNSNSLWKKLFIDFAQTHSYIVRHRFLFHSLDLNLYILNHLIKIGQFTSS